MLHRERVDPPHYIYPLDEWKIIEKQFHPRFMAQMESIFALGNGYLGFRGNFEEGTPVFRHGTFVNGFHEIWPIVYGEAAHGFAKNGQTMVHLPDTKIIRLFVDDEPFYLPTANLEIFERVLDMRTGRLTRHILWKMPSGRRVSISSERMVSFEHRHLAAATYTVTVHDASAPVVISSEIVPHRTIRGSSGDPRHTKIFRENVLVSGPRIERDREIIVGFETKRSRMRLACGFTHVIESDCGLDVQTIGGSDGDGKVVFTANARCDMPIRITKYMSYHTSRRADPADLVERTRRTLDRAVKNGYPSLAESQKKFLDRYWQTSDVIIGTGEATSHRVEELRQALRFNLFQLCQASARAEGTGLPAKGLTGEGYEGHYFWDTEIYVLPFLIYTQPRIAKNLLRFRHSMLDEARRRAAEVNQKGALFPWRTINGTEASAYYAAGTAQYHINADIVYALKKYAEATGDDQFLHKEGAEILVETARLWLDLGFYSKEKDNRFCIHGVTGPDEYNTVVNNNAYTNMMVKENLLYAAHTIDGLYRKKPELYRQLADRTDLKYAEVRNWKKAAVHMYIPYNEDLGIHPQDDSFLDKKEWDLQSTPREYFPLLLHYHPLVIYRHKVIKQADLILAMFLLGHLFSREAKKRNFDYYDRLTTGDSSLSVGIQSIAAAEIDYMDLAITYARYAMLMDLGDVGGNVSDGLHIASMGGAWMVMVYGFGGLRDSDGRISFSPRLPAMFESLVFRLRIRGRLLKVDIDKERVVYTLEEGDTLEIFNEEKPVRLAAFQPKELPHHNGREKKNENTAAYQ